jgi:transposase-like protein
LARCSRDTCGSGGRPGDRWHLDEMVVRIAGRRMYLSAVDQKDEILDLLIQPRRDKHAAGRLMRKSAQETGLLRPSWRSPTS